MSYKPPLPSQSSINNNSFTQNDRDRSINHDREKSN